MFDEVRQDATAPREGAPGALEWMALRGRFGGDGPWLPPGEGILPRGALMVEIRFDATESACNLIRHLSAEPAPRTTILRADPRGGDGGVDPVGE